MTKVDADTVEGMDAKATGFVSPYPSLNIELKQQNIANLKPGLAISVVGGIMLLLVTGQHVPAEFAWGWLAGLCLSSLALWLWMNQQQPRHLVTAAGIVSAIFWGLAGALFIVPDQLENALLVATIIVALTTAWSVLYIQTDLFRHLFLLAIYIPLTISLCIHFPALSLAFLGVLSIVYIALDRACVTYRRGFIDRALSNKRAEDDSQQVVTTSKKITSLIEQTPLGFIEWNEHREIIGWNPAATAIFGFTKSEVVGRTTDFLFEDKKTFLMQQAEHDLFLFGKDFSGTAENITKDSTRIICEWNETPLFDDDMNVIGAASFVEDVTDRVKMQSRIKQQAYFDPLTGLPNRHRLMEELNRVISLAQRTRNFCSLLFIDLDHFKEINDSRGHHYGDLALTLFAQRLRKVIRTQETVARLGGDEFVVLLERLGTESETARLQIAQVAEKIIDAASEPFVIKGEKFQISCSIGIVFFNDGTADGKTILEQADHALYTIKREGKSNYYFHDRKLSSAMQKQMELLERLRDESRAESFVPFYQPILDSKTNLINGLQVFLRWQKPNGEIVEAHEFIQVLESGSMIVDISLSLIDQVCKQVNLWRGQGLWQDQQRIYFTLSLRELEHPSFVAQVQEIMRRHDIKPNVFMFGLHTENLDKLNASLQLQLNRLNEIGCGLIIDNVGYQSLPLQKLRELQIDTIRISHRLMAETDEIESSWNLVKGLIELTKSVGLNCIAPCIEDPHIHHLLLDVGCQLLQGNLIAPPSPPTSITRMLIERNSSAEEEVSSQ